MGSAGCCLPRLTGNPIRPCDRVDRPRALVGHRYAQPDSGSRTLTVVPCPSRLITSIVP